MGEVLLVAMRRFQARSTPPPLAEAVATRFALQLAIRHGFEAIELEGDAWNLSNAILTKCNRHGFTEEW